MATTMGSFICACNMGYMGSGVNYIAKDACGHFLCEVDFTFCTDLPAPALDKAASIRARMAWGSQATLKSVATILTKCDGAHMCVQRGLYRMVPWRGCFEVFVGFVNIQSQADISNYAVYLDNVAVIDLDY